MGSIAEYYYIDIKAEAIVDGKKFDISNVDITYELNAIPVAEIDFPVGRAMSGNNQGKVSEFMGELSNARPFTPIEIFVTATPKPASRAAPAGKDRGFPSGRTRIFKGFLSAPSQNQNTMSSSVALHVTAVGMATALAGTTQFTTGLTLSGAASGGTLGVIRGGDGNTKTTIQAALLSASSNITGDLWENGLRPMIQSAIESTSTWSDQANDFAQQALDRINKGEALPSEPLDISSFGSGQVGEILKQCLAKKFAELFFFIWANKSGGMWDIIKLFQSAFPFYFVPAIEEDSIAPLIPTLSGEAHRIIDPNEYVSISTFSNYDSNFYAYITSVGIFSTRFQTSPWQGVTPDSKFIGHFSLSDELGGDDGRLLVEEAPDWLVPSSAVPKDSIFNSADKGSTGAGSAPEVNQGVVEESYFISGLGNAYAETRVYSEIFKHRGFDLVGRYRLDISPGSLIQVNTVGESFSSKKDTIFGMVNGVKINVGNSGKGGNASTSFSVIHTRSKAEHEKFTTSSHPLFQGAWRGGSLIKS
jgi:hypothetical protein